MERVSGMAVAAASSVARASATAMSGNALAQQRREKGHFVTPNKKVGTRFKNMQWVCSVATRRTRCPESSRTCHVARAHTHTHTHTLQVNRGNASDMRVFRALSGHIKGGRALYKRQHDHLSWGPRNFIRFANVRDMRRELEAASPDFASGTPCVLHSNSRDIGMAAEAQHNPTGKGRGGVYFFVMCAAIAYLSTHNNKTTTVGDNFDFNAVLKDRGEYAVPEGHNYDGDEYVHAWNKEELQRLRGDKWHKKYYNGAFPLHSL